MNYELIQQVKQFMKFPEYESLPQWFKLTIKKYLKALYLNDISAAQDYLMELQNDINCCEVDLILPVDKCWEYRRYFFGEEVNSDW